MTADGGDVRLPCSPIGIRSLWCHMTLVWISYKPPIQSSMTETYSLVRLLEAEWLIPTESQSQQQFFHFHQQNRSLPCSSARLRHADGQESGRAPRERRDLSALLAGGVVAVCHCWTCDSVQYTAGNLCTRLPGPSCIWGALLLFMPPPFSTTAEFPQ